MGPTGHMGIPNIISSLIPIAMFDCVLDVTVRVSQARYDAAGCCTVWTSLFVVAVVLIVIRR